MNIPKFVRHPDKRTVILAFTLGTLAALALQLVRAQDDPEFVLLDDRAGAHWIYHQYPKFTHMIEPGELTTSYYTSFTVSRVPGEAVLQVQALKSFSVRVDGRLVRDFGERDAENWKEETRLDLAPHLSPGTHRLDLIVKNYAGPTAVWARAPELGLYTNEDWDAYIGSGQTGEVRLASAPPRVPEGYPFDPAWTEFARALPVLIPLFIVTVAAVLYGRRKLAGRIPPQAARWVAMASVLALLILGLNNMFRLDYRYGFDASGHYAYIEWIADGKGLPLATDGWQMFQSPLYYVLAAPVYAVFDSDDAGAADGEESTFKYYPVRIVSIVCGALQPVLAYLLAKMVWPDRPRLQIFAILFAAFLPVNIYMAQYVGNEPLMSVVGAAALLLGAYILKQDRPPGTTLAVACGVVLGLGLLTKASAILLFPTCFLAFASRFWRMENGLREFGKKLAIVAGACFLVSGWYYIRNWVLLGEPFVGGWETRAGMEWWQAPGYRTWDEYLRFGRALIFPVYAAYFGLWDALYTTFWLDGLLGSVNLAAAEPMWSVPLLVAGAWVALVPAIVLLTGALVPLWRMLRNAKEPWSYLDRLQAFAAGTIFIYLIAIFYMHLRVPIWSGGKASYLTATTPLLAFLAVRGLLLLENRGRAVGNVVVAWFACWFALVYITYFTWAPIRTDF